MQPWLGAAAFALVAWAFQRLLSKVALTELGTRKFYLLSGAVSLVVYAPYLALRPPTIFELPPALALACLMALTFGIAILGERLNLAASLGVALAPAGVVLLSIRPHRTLGRPLWLHLAVLSLALQGFGAFFAKLVVTASGPSALLLLSAGVQVLVGLFLAPPSMWRRPDLRGRPAMFTVVAYAIGAVATIAYLLALAAGSAAIVVPLVATSPALAGLLGILVFRVGTRPSQLAGIGLAVVGAVLLSGKG